MPGTGLGAWARTSKNPGGRTGVLEVDMPLVAGKGFEPLTFGL